MIAIGRTWQLWASRYESGKLWNIGERRWVELHGLAHPVVPVLVEEVLGDDFDPAVTHYGWEDKEHPRRQGQPSMIQVRTGDKPDRARMFLDMCFPYGLKAAIASADGKVVALRITERSDDPA